MLYAVGDIHGERTMLEELLEALPVKDDDRFVFVGDYVDRGPDPHGVVEFLTRFAAQRPCIFLLGNHESMFLDFLGWEHPAYFGGDAFLMNGGDRTLWSYGYFDLEVADPEAFRLPPHHEAFFRSLKLYHVEPGYAFVHAGVGRDAQRFQDVEQALQAASFQDLLWDRVSADLPHELGATVVYGHTPSPYLGVRWNRPFSIGIDTGAVYGGNLTALRLPDEKVFQI